MRCSKGQLAIRQSEAPSAPRELLDLTTQLLAILKEQTGIGSGALDEKLAEYVFFPMYHIFRQMDQYPMMLVENCVKCLQILITHGWKSQLSAKMVQQILSLLIFIIDGTPDSRNKRDVPEETVLETFRAQTALFDTIASSATASYGLTEQDTIPILGHGIAVMLDGAVDGANAEVQGEALKSLQAVNAALRDQDALASFLPGTVSSLTKILATPKRHKTAVLSGCLETTQLVLTRVLGDMRTRSILGQQGVEQNSIEGDKILGPAWLKATVHQVKLALSTTMKLRTHDAPAVKMALEKLCITLLDECRATLSNCTAMLVETAIILDCGDDSNVSAQTSLRHLAIIYPELGEDVKTTVYNWMSSLSRIMQAADEDSKRVAVHNLSKGVGLLQSLGIESSTLEDAISSALRDSIIAIMKSASHPSSPSNQLQLLDGSTLQELPGQAAFQPVILARESQKGLRFELLGLMGIIGSATQKAKLGAMMMEYVHDTPAEDQVAAMWLCFELLKAAQKHSAETEAFLDLSSFSLAERSGDSETLLDDLYGWAIQILDSHLDSDSTDWRLEALSMEVAAYAAHRSGLSFRPELIDVLFPVATYLGSEKVQLQQHAMATLNSIAGSCQYASVSDLMVENVDYMVNSVSLRLNTLDISPASMQVLLMMIRLAGSRLIPFLDDVVDSVFAALDNYHGYTFFVESLFSVLKEIVDQASEAERGLLTDRERTAANHKKKAPEGKFVDLLDFLDKRKARQDRDAAEAAGEKRIQGHPETPWTSDAAGDATGVPQEPERAPSDERPPNSPTYQLLLRIATSTQHYLTSPTPKLRRSLLALLTTASSILAGDEDAFLPLVNAVWPVVIGRLYDQESYITIEACHALSGLCQAAGDFLSSRFRTEWGDGLGAWCSKVKEQASSRSTRRRPFEADPPPGRGSEVLIPIRSQGGLEGRLSTRELGGPSSSSLGLHASPVKVWEAVVKLLTSIVSYVHVEEGMFDDILLLLSEVLEENKEVREALSVINADAVWLVRYERGLVEPLPTPKVEGFTFAGLAQVPRTSD
ncbi:hypothetical protein RJ55_04187 [Drechmeria coniospora]|nr:hypothetical protein RJ55_04187 [Drechmeria coniospora]